MPNSFSRRVAVPMEWDRSGRAELGTGGTGGSATGCGCRTHNPCLEKPAGLGV